MKNFKFDSPASRWASSGLVTLPTVLLMALMMALITGCMTAPTGPAPEKEDPLAAARSKAYLEQVDLLTAGDKFPQAKTCMVPAAADKLGPAQSADGHALGPSKDWKVLVVYADACAREKNWKTLETLANSIARMDIDSPWGAYFLSLAAEGTGDLQRAAWMADLAQKKAGGRSGLYAYQKGRVLFALKDTTHAMQEIERAVEFDTHLAEGYFFLGEIHDRDLEVDSAKKNYEAALSAQPTHYGALVNLAELNIASGSGAEAVPLLSKAIETHPEQLRAWLRLAYVYEAVQKNTAQALNTYRGLKTSIDNGSVHERPDFDLNAKIKTLESASQARVPAQASAAPVPSATAGNEQKSVK